MPPATPCVSAIAGHPISTQPRAGGILLLGQEQEIPRVGDPDGQQRHAARAARPREQLAGTCPPATVDLGTWCLDSAPYPLTNADAGKNNFIWASKACEAEGGWLPSRLRTARRAPNA